MSDFFGDVFDFAGDALVGALEVAAVATVAVATVAVASEGARQQSEYRETLRARQRKLRAQEELRSRRDRDSLSYASAHELSHIIAEARENERRRYGDFDASPTYGPSRQQREARRLREDMTRSGLVRIALREIPRN